MDSTIEIEFEKKTEDILVWNGQTVMSRTETEYFAALFACLRFLRPSKVLEIGFGLGVSANLIQKNFSPVQHDICEIEHNIYKDLQTFAKKHSRVRAFAGDWQTMSIDRGYDFIFYDPFDYIPDGQQLPGKTAATASRLKQLLRPSGVLSHPHFGDGDAPNIEGFDTVIVKRLKMKPIIMADQTMCEDVAILYHQPQV